MSTVRKVALFGRPIAGAGDRVDLLDRVLAGGQRLENADEAVHGHVVRDESRRVLRDRRRSCPSRRSTNSRTAATTAGSVSPVGMSSTQRQIARRVEEMRAEPVAPEIRRCGPRRGRRSESPDVFELTIEPGRRTASTRSSSARFASACSMTASMIQSACARSGQIRVEAARPDALDGVSAVKNGSGFSFRARSRPSRAACARHVEQTERGIRRWPVRGDLRAHRSGAEHGADRIRKRRA